MTMFPVSIDDVHWDRNGLLLMLILLCFELNMLLLIVVSIVHHPTLQYWCWDRGHGHGRTLVVAHCSPHAVGGRGHVVSAHWGRTGGPGVGTDVA